MKVWKKFASFVVLGLAFCLAGVGFVFANATFPVSADETSVLRRVELSDDAKELAEDYLDTYSIPTAHFKFKTNGGEGEIGGKHFLSYAFDRNFSTNWESVNSFTGDYPFVNNIVVTFDSKVMIDRFIYGSENGTTRGFAMNIKIFESIDGKTFKEIGHLEAGETQSLVLFTFSEVTCKAFKIEFWGQPTYHRTTATAREIIFLQPESDAMNKTLDIFSNYSETSLRSDISTLEDVEQLKLGTEGYVCDGVEAKLLRAEQILNGTLCFDKRREFSTDSGSENVISQFGDVAAQARTNLKMTWFSTNRQSTGIGINAGQDLTIYVTGTETDKLPRLVYTQFWGHWSSWNSGEIQLRLGKNVVKARDFVNGNWNVIAGGSVYLVNPYKPTEQSNQVKVYIEGGTLFPVFHLDGDEEKYLLQLQSYLQKVEREPDKVIDMTELVSNHFIMTVRASVANSVYAQGNSPQENLETWDAYIQEVLEFDGVQFRPTDPHYDERNLHINCNIRLMQPYGGAYAYTEHVGIQPSWEKMAIFTKSFGWGYTHELGHMMDIGERTVSECSNNMMSKYNETAMEKEATRGEFVKTLAALTPDTQSASFFNTNRLNFLIWWLIESFDIGFWGRLENLYRYDTTISEYKAQKLAEHQGEKDYKFPEMTATEKQVYLSSLATKIDLSYYFERWGYNLGTNDAIFETGKTSQTFNDLMQNAVSGGKISKDKKPKLWYLDAKQYLLKKEGGTAVYDQNVLPTITSVTKTAEGFTLLLSSPKQNEKGHLGFEIWEGSGQQERLLGFTYTNMFLDTTDYAGRTPTYHIVAYDRDLNASKKSDTTPVTEISGVCKIGQRVFNSVASAVQNASSGETIVLLKDTYEDAILVDKNLTITVDDSLDKNITIFRAGNDDVVKVCEGVTLTIRGKENSKIVFDGQSFLQGSSLIKVEGSINLDYVVLQNNKTTGTGGGMTINSKSTTQSMTANFVEFRNNSAKNGGGFFSNGNRMTTTFNNCVFDSNSAENGGGIYNSSGTVVYYNLCKITNNTATNSGGGLWMESYNELNGCEVKGNSAVLGGGIFYGSTTAKRYVHIKSWTPPKNSETNAATQSPVDTTITSNTAQKGAAIYASVGVVNVYKAQISGNKGDFPIWVQAGEVRFNAVIDQKENICQIEEDIFVGDTAKVTVLQKMFDVTDKINVQPEIEASGKVLLIAENFDFQSTDIQKLERERGEITISENKRQLVVSIQKRTLTFNINGKQTSVQVDDGSTYVLGDECETEGKYLKEWKKGSQTLKPLEEFVVNEDAVFDAVLDDMHIITLDIEGSEETFYVVPQHNFSLPEVILAQATLLGWRNERGEILTPLSTIKNVTKNQKFSAVLSKKIKVTLKFLGNEYDSFYADYNDFVDLSKVEVPENAQGRKLDWKMNGQSVEAATVTVKGEMELDATPHKEGGSLVYILLCVGFVLLALGAGAYLFFKNKKKSKK